MTEEPTPRPTRGELVSDEAGRRIGRIDAVFADYVLVRTSELLPIDLYIPIVEIAGHGGARRVAASSSEARERWHRPLKRAPHDGQ